MVTVNLKTWEVNTTLFSLKIPVISEMKTNVIWKEADIFSIVHIYWVVNYTFCIDFRLIFDKYQSTLGKRKNVRWSSEPLMTSFIHQVTLEYLRCVTLCPQQGCQSGWWGWQSIEEHVICHRALSTVRDSEVQVRSSSSPNKEMRPLVNRSFRTWKSPSLKSNVWNVHLGSKAGTCHSFSDPQRTWIIKFPWENWPWCCPKPPHW